MRRLRIAFLAFFVSTLAQAAPANNVVLVTVDGLRWQEVFRGADARLLSDERFTPKGYSAFSPHQTTDATTAREQLMPFFWKVIAMQGAVLGDRDRGSQMRVANPWWFSYPGYNEILTGRADPSVDSNDKRWNANVTVLEWLNRRPEFQGRVQVFGSWAVFPYIINSERSGIPVNVGGSPIVGRPTQREAWLQELQTQMPLAFPAVRHDALTHQHALEALQTDRPRILYIAYGEPDDFAHEGKYGEYLDATHRFDQFLEALWSAVQSDRHYKGRTALIITTDHGRGEIPLENWRHHSSKQAARRSDESSDGIAGSEQIWFAALGTGIKARGVIRTEQELLQSQVAATLLSALGLDRSAFNAEAAPELPGIVAR